MNKKRKKVIENNEISKIYEFKLGGYFQKVLIEGKKKNLPIIITLHGGPGSPLPFSVGCRGMFPQFTDKFIMVYWDQLGCGINNYDIDDSFTIDNFLTMAIDLLKEVRKLFPNNKIYIFSTSWGSVLSALMAAKNPSEIDGVVVSGQIVRNLFFNEEVLKTLNQSNISRTKLDILQKVTSETANSKDLKLMSSSLMKYTNAYYNKSGEKSSMFSTIIGLLTSPDYKFKDFKAIIFNGYRSNNSIWNELLKINLTDTLSNMKIPYVIIQGDTDIIASTKTVQKLVKNANNKNLQMYVVKNSGHLPSKAMIEEIIMRMSELIISQEITGKNEH